MGIVGNTSKGRLIAAFVDHLIAFALMMLVVALVPEEFPVVKGVLFFLIYLSYFAVLEALWSRTFGKYFQGLVVRKLDGSRCDWRASLIPDGVSTRRWVTCQPPCRRRWTGTRASNSESSTINTLREGRGGGGDGRS